MTATVEPAVIRFDLSAAQDALARSDEGADPLPGDAVLIDQYEAFCQQEQARYEDALAAAEHAAWLVEQCPECEPGGGSGEPCDDHYDEGAVA
jgi:hypothetical protein